MGTAGTMLSEVRRDDEGRFAMSRLRDVQPDVRHTGRRQ
jgi:hypothetical protein